ncbi:MAG: TolC family protein [Acidobacteriota bacterium]
MKTNRFLCFSLVIFFGLAGAYIPSSHSEEGKAGGLSLSLDRCIELALENNLVIAAQRIDPEINRLNYEIARTLFDPNLSTGGSRSVSNSQAVTFISITKREYDNYDISLSGKALTGGSYSLSLNASRTYLTAGFPITFNPSYTTGINLNITQPFLRNFGREVTKHNILVSKNSYDMSLSSFQRIVIDTVTLAEQAYWNLVGAIDNLKVQKESLKLAEDQLERNRIMVKVGTRAPIDVTDAEATVASRVLSVINAENAVKAAEDSLRKILNIAPGTSLWDSAILPTDRPSFEAVSVDLEASIDAALRKRPEIEESRINLKNLELTMRYQKNQGLPLLDLSGSYGLSGVSGTILPGPDGLMGTPDDIFVQEGISGAFDDVKDRNYTNWSLGLNFAIPIMNRAASRQYVISKLNYDKANIQHKSLEQQIAIDVKEAARNIEMSLKRLDAARASKILSRERLNAAQKKFENGMATNFEVAEYQQYLATAESEEINALIEYNKALLSLEKAQGTLLQKRGIVLESSQKK